MSELLTELKGKIIVSCQGTKESGPFYKPEHMALMADAAVFGGAAGFRVNTPPNIREIKKKYPDYPVIGIYKINEGDNPVYITPNMDAVDELVALGCEIIAMDGTNRKNSRGNYAWELIKKTKEKYPRQLVMADTATIEDARLSSKAGADIISTTLSGYTEQSQDYKNKANFDLLKQIKDEKLTNFIIAEGKIWTLADAEAAFNAGADAIVIGTAITAPGLIAKRFVDHFAEK